ncbi:MAG: hypothetical protein ABSG49_06345 [Methanoregula sp.]|jgi:RPA family protein|uniref:hypothetical protein n=1 Tax=Methanoregula sp. TaxID=2052170 RepID=UPI003C23A9D9
MEGAARVFAGEFGQSTLLVAAEEPGTPGYVVTPGGAWCRQMYLAGALTETVENGDMLRCRIADPTGAFDVVAGGRNATLVQTFRKIPVPSFVGINGYAQMYRKNGSVVLSVRPEHVQVLDRAVRDQIVLIAAEYTLRRLEQVRLALEGACSDNQILRATRHYSMTKPRVLELARMVEGAVQSVRSQESPLPAEKPDVRSVVLEHLQNASGPRGVAIEEIIELLSIRGLRKEDVLAALESLIRDDECYQPQKGYVKPL